MSAQDYRINAEVRRFMVSRWVDVTRLQLGTTNGVVYVIGTLDTSLEDPGRQYDLQQLRDGSDRVLRLAVRLDKELHRLRDVRDVVFKLTNVSKRGGRWRVADLTDSAG